MAIFKRKTITAKSSREQLLAEREAILAELDESTYSGEYQYSFAN